MRNLLLDAGSFEKFIPVIILLVFLILAVIIFVIITKKNTVNEKRVKTKEIDTQKSMQLKVPFLNSMENNFLYNFQKILPDEYVVYPKVSIKQVILPYNNKTFFDYIHNRTLDYVVFLRKNMQPVVVIDIHDRTGVQKSIADDDKYLGEALRNVKLPVVDYEVRQDYEPAELLRKFLDALDPVAIANLQKNRERY